MNIPLIGLGVGGYDYNSTYEAVLKSLKLGYRLIDTAENYHNEEAVGNAIIDSGIHRNEITIITKYFGGYHYGNPNHVLHSFESSLKKLKTTYIDVYLVHKPFACKVVDSEWQPIHTNKIFNYKSRLSVWLQMMDLKTKNKVKYIGVSNWTWENIQELKWNELDNPDVTQIEWCPSYHDYKMFEYCKNNDIKIMGYGLFSRNDELQILSIDNNKPSDVIIKWCTQQNITVIVRSNNCSKLISNMNVINQKWLLNEAEIESINSTPQKPKGHSLFSVYAKNNTINFWKPCVWNNQNNAIDDLILGNVSCILIHNVLTEEDCANVLKTMEEKKLLLNDLPYENYGLQFRNLEIGIQ